MAGYQITEPTAGSTDWTSTATQREKQRKGFMALSLTNYDDSTATPAIQSGSVVEMGGSLYQFTSTESITETFSTSNFNYIYLTSSSSQLTASCTSGTPSWNASKQGWYDSGGTKRCVGGYGWNRNMKFLFNNGPDNRMSKTIAIGDWDMDADSAHNLDHGIPISAIRGIEGFIRNDNKDTYYPILVNYVDTPTSTSPVVITYLNATQINMVRDAGGIFDGAGFDDVGGAQETRGWVTVHYAV